MDAEKAILEDLAIEVSLGATLGNGRDSYPYYISEILPNKVIGFYQAQAKFDQAHPWEGGTMVVDPFDPNHPSDFYAKRRYGQWWKVTKDAQPLSKWTGKYASLKIGTAYAYQDPSF